MLEAVADKQARREVSLLPMHLACRWVAVAGWQWYRWKEEVKAVRMIPVWEWQWQYWPSCGEKYQYCCFKKMWVKNENNSGNGQWQSEW
jgi:hypothetical protein